jgi:predicted amidohydrolase YtcJ
MSTSSAKTREVLVQHAMDPLGLAYKSHRYEVALRPLDQGWFVLESLRHLGELESPRSSASYLHKGYFDGHLHSFWAGAEEESLSLKGLSSLEAATKRLLDFAAAAPASLSYLRAFGWDESRWGVKLEDVIGHWNKVLPREKPMLVARICGHSAWISPALKALVNNPSLPAWVSEQTYFSLTESIPQPSEGEEYDRFLRFQQRLIALGISAISEMSLTDKRARILKKVAENGELLVDVIGVLDARKALSCIAEGPQVHRNKFLAGPSDREAYLIFRHWKRFLDGSFGSHTAWLSKAYSDKETFGESQEDNFELLAQARKALRQGFCLSFHSIGDAALEQALYLGRELRTEMRARSREDGLPGLPPARHRLEHVQMCRPEQLTALAEQDFWAFALQPSHRELDDGFARERLGEPRLSQEAYRLASFQKHRIPFALSSDNPIAPLEPAKTFSSMNFHAEHERVSAEDLLWKFTVGGRLALSLPTAQLEVGSTVRVTEL